MSSESFSSALLKIRQCLRRGNMEGLSSSFTVMAFLFLEFFSEAAIILLHMTD